MANFDISGLTLLAQRAPEIIGKLLIQDTVLKYFVPHEGYNPGHASIRLYDGGGDLGECCTTPETSGSFTEVTTPVKCIMSGNEFCETELATYLNDLKFRFTAGQEQLDKSLEELLTEQELAKVSLNIDRLVWQGDTTSANQNLNRIDGLIKQATASSASVKIDISSGNIYTALQQVIMALPLDAYDQAQNMYVFVGRDVAQPVLAAMVALNLFHYNPGERRPNDPFTIPGFAGVQVIPTRGLDGTGKVIAVPNNNAHWITNIADDHMKLNWDYTKYHQLYYWRLKFVLGLTFGFFENVVIATLADSVLTAPVGIPVSVVAPVGTAGGIVTENAA